MNSKTKILIGFLIVLVAVAFWFFNNPRQTQEANKNSGSVHTSYEFRGAMTKYEKGSLHLIGDYYSKEQSNKLPEQKKVKVATTELTLFFRIQQPMQKADASGNVTIDTSKKAPIAREAISLAQLEADIPAGVNFFVVKSQQNIYGKNEFAASEIEYSIIKK